MSTKPATLEVAKSVVVFTTRNHVSAAEILQWYQVLWQIELVFKRLKSWSNWVTHPNTTTAVVGPGYTGKLLVDLLTQKLIRIARDIFPWGCRFSDWIPTKPVA
jgi:hypothetical protein